MATSDRREIGPVGTESRVLGGAAALVIPLVIWGASWWDWAAGLLGFPLFAATAGLLFGRRGARKGVEGAAGPDRAGWAAALALVVVVLGGATALTFITPVDGTGVWIFLGISMLLAAAKGYGGCEVLAFSSALTGRRYRTPCLLYGPIDAAEGTGARAVKAR